MADEYYNNKIVTTDGDVLIDLTSDTAEASDVLQGKTLHLASGAPAVGTYRPSDEIVARLEATVGHSGKNYISYDTSTYTYTANGITFTLDLSAGTVTANGTATANTEFRIPFNHITTIYGNVVYTKKPIKSGKYYFCGSPSGGTSTSYWCFVYDNTTGSGAKKWDGTSGISRDYGDVHKNEVLIDDTHSQRFTILIANGYTASNVVFRPMIWSGDIDDDTFEPYIEPTDSQIETKTRAYLTSTVGHVGKNQFSFGSQSLTRVIAGVTFTVDPVAGTVTANGTSTSSSGSQYNIRITGNQAPDSVANRPSRSISNGKYYFCGCPSGGSVEKASYNVYIWDYAAGARAKRWNGSTNVDTDIGVTTKNELLINDQSHTLSYNIRVFDTNGQNKVFRPMIWSGDIDDDTFEPYIEPTDRQIETKARAYLTSSLGHVSKNVFNLYTHRTISANTTLSTCDNETGTIIANATGAWKAISWEDNRFIQDSTKRYIVSGTNNIANSLGRISINNRTDQLAYTKVNLSSTGSFSFEIVPSDYPDGFWLQVYMTSTSSTTATGSVNISNFMIREASIADDTFEPYRIPTDERVYSLDIAAANASQYVPDPDKSTWITIIDHYSTRNNQFDIYISTNSDGGYFFGVSESYPIPEHEVKLPRFHNYKENAISFGLVGADSSDPVMAISSNPGMFSPSHTTSMWDKVFSNLTFFEFLDVKDGMPTRYMHIHLCDDGGIRNQAEYEAYIGS